MDVLIERLVGRKGDALRSYTHVCVCAYMCYLYVHV